MYVKFTQPRTELAIAETWDCQSTDCCSSVVTPLPPRSRSSITRGGLVWQTTEEKNKFCARRRKVESPVHFSKSETLAHMFRTCHVVNPYCKLPSVPHYSSLPISYGSVAVGYCDKSFIMTVLSFHCLFCSIDLHMNINVWG